MEFPRKVLDFETAAEEIVVKAINFEYLNPESDAI